MKYIDTELLRKDIEKHIKEVKDAAKRYRPNMGFFSVKLSGIYDVMAIIDSLQQEQPEVDLEKEIATWIPSHITGGEEGVWKECREAVTKWAGIVAHHFYELGLKARKEE